MDNYYEKNAEKYFRETLSYDMTSLIDYFLSFIPNGTSILDLGSGSGRDTKIFIQKGYKVIAVDASQKLVDLSTKYTGIQTIHSTFEEFETSLKFDGIWACASLLHASKNDIRRLLNKYLKLLNEAGVFYMSFKKGNEDYKKSGRSFLCFDVENMMELLFSLENCNVLDVFESISHRNDKLVVWVNAFVRRIS